MNDPTLEDNIRQILENHYDPDWETNDITNATKALLSLYQKELVRELESFTGYATEIPEAEIKARIKELTGEQP